VPLTAWLVLGGAEGYWSRRTTSPLVGERYRQVRGTGCAGGDRRCKAVGGLGDLEPPHDERARHRRAGARGDATECSFARRSKEELERAGQGLTAAPRSPKIRATGEPRRGYQFR